ncbi:uncharacterized protein An04g05370 [Aspergillus niger]|uniref:Contig An04c0170, genomic contig n=2 Tax=Aspergillus niger TaxID=5061 RepID=A2QJ05_ASPNC|nr:uncharacterized protein An04g05370 [Aspergillus niger]CAK38799.1 unnamed protein product [Aspergillus niger]
MCRISPQNNQCCGACLVHIHGQEGGVNVDGEDGKEESGG